MRLLHLDIENVGPFDRAQLDLRGTDSEEDDAVPVTLLTGMNGTGKSTLIDAIREVLGDRFRSGRRLSRSVFRTEEGHIRVKLKQGDRPVETCVIRGGDMHTASWHHFENGSSLPPLKTLPGWIVDYWQSNLDRSSFAITNMTVGNPEEFLDDALLGEHRNIDTTALICHFDYLRDSHDPVEKRDGELLYQAMERIASFSLPDGTFSHVARTRLEPMFKQRGQLLGLSKLSAGSHYLLQRMLGMLDRMYGCWVVGGRRPGTSLFDIPGLLLIDEAENHLHPQWQKRLLPTIRKTFPNLQLIVATHSPFILASIKGARVYVCSAEGDQCTVTDVSDVYANKPVDEILLSPAFAETQPFSEEITDLLDRREQAILNGDRVEQEAMEQELLALTGHEIPAELRQRILSCTDVATLDRWHARVRKAESLADIFAL